MEEKSSETAEVLPLDRYIRAVAICNSLALLASQGTMAQYIQRIAILAQLQKYWKKGYDTVTLSCADYDDGKDNDDDNSPDETVDDASIALQAAAALASAEQPDNWETHSNSTVDLKPDIHAMVSEPELSEPEEKPERKSHKKSTDADRPKRGRKPGRGASSQIYPCSKCGETFKYRSVLVRHENQKHKSTEDKEGDTDGVKQADETQPAVTTKELERSKSMEKRKTKDKSQSMQRVKVENVGYAVLAAVDEDIYGYERDKANSLEISRAVGKSSTLKQLFRDAEQSLSNIWAAVQTIDDRDEQQQPPPQQQSNKKKPHKCQLCDLCFDRKAKLRRHEEAHARDYKQRMSNRMLLGKSQMNSAPPRARPFKCSMCDKSFYRRVTCQRHEAGHQEWIDREQMAINAGGKIEFVEINKQMTRMYACTKCGQKFMRPVRLQRHLELGCSLQCRYCGKLSSRRAKHRRHEATHQQNKASAAAAAAASESGSGAAGGADNAGAVAAAAQKVRPHMCSVCGQSFTTSTILRSHLLTHSGERPLQCRIEGCTKRFAQHSTRAFHERTHSDEAPYICPDCGRTFKHPITLRLHSRVHSSVRPYKCTECSKTFRQHSAMAKHLLIHTNERRISCPQCPKKFRDGSSMRRHLAAIHVGDKPFNCSVCDKSFTQPGNLRVHMRTHTGEKPFCCPICGLRFSHSGTLKGHLHVHVEMSRPCSVVTVQD